jgi:uncharacterized membrane protein YhaH (DUF805 family)
LPHLPQGIAVLLVLGTVFIILPNSTRSVTDSIKTKPHILHRSTSQVRLPTSGAIDRAWMSELTSFCSAVTAHFVRSVCARPLRKRKLAQAAMLLTCIPEMPNATLGPDFTISFAILFMIFANDSRQMAKRVHQIKPQPLSILHSHPIP